MREFLFHHQKKVQKTKSEEIAGDIIWKRILQLIQTLTVYILFTSPILLNSFLCNDAIFNDNKNRTQDILKFWTTINNSHLNFLGIKSLSKTISWLNNATLSGNSRWNEINFILKVVAIVYHTNDHFKHEHKIWVLIP